MKREQLSALLSAGAGASVDTRTLNPGEVFFGLPGTSTHGAAFARLALEKGAAALVVPPAHATGLPPEKTLTHEDPLTLLQEEARWHRQRFPDLFVVAIGGSNGKTTTRALLAHILSQQAPTLFTPRSWNNAIGLPLTLLRLKPHHRYAVLEVGDNHPGEVAFLTELIRPTWGLITNVGLDHLEGYGSYEANLHTKWELTRALEKYSPAPRLFLNSEDEGLGRMRASTSVPITLFGKGGAVEGEWFPLSWQASRLSGIAYAEPFSVEVPLWGRFNRLNVLGAIAVARALGVPWSTIAEALIAFSPEWGRSQILEYSGRRLIFDAYNANPSSLRASLESLWEMLGPGDKVGLILGQLEELGSYARTAHTEMLTCLKDRHPFLAGVALIGPLWREADPPAEKDLFHYYDSVETFLQSPVSWAWTSPLLYLKGSRRVGLERLIPHLEQLRSQTS